MIVSDPLRGGRQVDDNCRPGRANDSNVVVATQADGAQWEPQAEISAHLRRILERVGVNLKDPHLRDTPERAARALYGELLSGYRADPAEIFRVFEERYDDTVLVKDIPFYSLCAHHLLPFFGTASIAYRPDRRVLGLSKFFRLVDCFSRRLQVQERLTTEIAESIDQHLAPRGLIVLLRAEHLCMAMRGIRAAGTETVTYKCSGAFAESTADRNQVFGLLEPAKAGR